MPEIPASASGVASTDDDDEEDEGHYDVISKSRRAAAAANTQTKSQPQKPRFCHPYEIVAGDSDSTYAGIREELEAVISLRNSRGRASSSETAAAGAVAHEISDPLYAGITDDGSDIRRQALPSTVAVRPRIPSTYSTTVNNPQRLHVGDHAVESERPMSVSVLGVNDAESPLLPPRNGNIDNVDGVASAAACPVSNSWSQPTAAMSTLSAGGGTANGSANVTTTVVVHGDPAVHAQELQLLHNNASADAMPVTGTGTSSSVV